jgi:hypothetical protein
LEEGCLGYYWKKCKLTFGYGWVRFELTLWWEGRLDDRLFLGSALEIAFYLITELTGKASLIRDGLAEFWDQFWWEMGKIELLGRLKLIALVVFMGIEAPLS